MSLEVVSSIEEVRARLTLPRKSGQVIGLVPTMGALHEGHGGLIDQARGVSDFLVVSIFVNPLQFGPQEDLERYPRPLDEDARFCASHGVDLVFAPSEAEMYPVPPETFVEVGGVAKHLCGAHRPGHFRGVATAVIKLFHVLKPDRAFFGEKDMQQLAVISTMVRDLNIEVEIVTSPTVREPDGLAWSSRNRYLNSAQRQSATALYRALRVIRERIGDGEKDPAVALGAGTEVLALEPSLRIEYAEIVDTVTMQPVGEITGPVRAAAAVWIGETRLIDNLLCEPGKRKRRARTRK